jgi:hypothetical protein
VAGCGGAAGDEGAWAELLVLLHMAPRAEALGRGPMAAETQAEARRGGLGAGGGEPR